MMGVSLFWFVSVKGSHNSFQGLGNWQIIYLTDFAVGTYRWLAPEVFINQLVSPASDVFSYGIVVWEMQTCESPYKDIKVPATIMYQVGTMKLRPPIPDDCPIPLKVLMQQCWDADRKKRPVMDEVIVDLCRSRKTGGKYIRVKFIDREISLYTINVYV